jgi:hypothetical protein
MTEENKVQQEVANVPAPTPVETESTVAEAAPAPASTPAAAAEPVAAEKPAAPAFNEAEWDEQKKTIDKVFVKGFSPRIFRYPFSLEIDILRCIKAAAARGLTVVEPKGVMDIGGSFFSKALLEVTGDVKEGDSGLVILKGEYYTKVAKRGFLGMKKEVAEIQKTLGGTPKELYFWHATYPTYTGKAAKTVIIASTDVTPIVEKKKAEKPAAQAPAQPEAAPAAETPAVPVQPAEPVQTPATPAATPSAPTPEAPAAPAQTPPPAQQ